jgi:serine/threonine-protein kinase
MRPLIVLFVCSAALAACAPTEVFYGDTPGVGRIVAGVLDVRFGGTPVDGMATETRLGIPGAVALGPDGDFYLTDRQQGSVAHVARDGSLQWIIGRGPICLTPGPAPDGNARDTCLRDPVALLRAPGGDLYVSDQTGNRVYRYSATDSLVTVVLGTGAAATSPAGVPAATAPVHHPYGLWLAEDGSLYVVERSGHRVLRVDPEGMLQVVAGSGERGDGGDGGPATQALLQFPEGVAMLGGTLFVADAGNHRLRRVDADVIDNYAGVGVAGLRGDGGPVSQALFRRPSQLTTVGNLLMVVDRGNNRIRAIRVGADSITTWAGTGGLGPGFDLTDITRTDIGGPQGVAILERVVVIADSGGAVIRRVIR